MTTGIIATITAIAGGLFWLVIRLVRGKAKSDERSEQAKQSEQKRKEAERAAAKERDAGGDDDAIRQRLRDRLNKRRGL